MLNKKYKHKKTGIIYSRSQNYNYYTNGYELIPKYIIEDSKDWEEMKDKPLLITKDGVVIYPGDECWYIIEDFNIQYGPCFNSTLRQTDYIFSTEKAAKDWLEINKPKYSLNKIRIFFHCWL